MRQGKEQQEQGWFGFHGVVGVLLVFERFGFTASKKPQDS
jgi:hypothetical protein